MTLSYNFDIIVRNDALNCKCAVEFENESIYFTSIIKLGNDIV